MKKETSSDTYRREDFQRAAFDMCITLTGLYFFSPRRLGNPVWRKSYKATFGNIGTAMVKKEISSAKNGKQAFCETALW